ncbi:hypothetical protein MRX96_058740 [Rhipicephalus microplus]
MSDNQPLTHQADEAADDCRGFPWSRPEDTLDEAEARRISDTRSLSRTPLTRTPHIIAAISTQTSLGTNTSVLEKISPRVCPETCGTLSVPQVYVAFTPAEVVEFATPYSRNSHRGYGRKRTAPWVGHEFVQHYAGGTAPRSCAHARKNYAAVSAENVKHHDSPQVRVDCERPKS